MELAERNCGPFAGRLQPGAGSHSRRPDAWSCSVCASWNEYALEAGNDRQTCRRSFRSVLSGLRGRCRAGVLTCGLAPQEAKEHDRTRASSTWHFARAPGRALATLESSRPHLRGISIDNSPRPISRSAGSRAAVMTAASSGRRCTLSGGALSPW